MPLDVKGLDQLVGDINRMAHALNTADEGAPAAKRILQAAAVPIDAQMKANASSDPKIITDKLHGAISTGKVKKRKTTGLHITIGVHRKDWDDEECKELLRQRGMRRTPPESADHQPGCS